VAKPLKILLFMILAPVLLITVALIAILIFVDPNDYRDQIESAVKENTGRELAIEGDIALSVFPWLGLELGRVSLGNAPGFGETPFAQVDGVEVRAQLMPLLNRELEVGTLKLAGLRLNLQQNAKGMNNWTDLAGDERAKPKEQDERVEGGEGRGLAVLAIGGLEITDAQLSFQDAVSGARYQLSDFSLTSGAIALGKPTELDLRFRVEANQPELHANIGLQTTLTLTESLRQVTLADTRLEIDGKGAALPVPELTLRLSSHIALDLAADTLAVSQLQLKTLGMVIGAEVKGSQLTKNPQFAGNLRLEPFNPRNLILQLGQPIPEMADTAALGKLSVDTAFTASTKRAALSDLKVLLDDTALTGKLSVTDFARQSLRFDLNLDIINLDRYLPPPQEAPPTAGAATVGTAELPMDLLRSPDVAGTVRIEKLIASNLRSEKVKVGISAKGGRIKVHPATAKLYGGSYNGNIGLDARGKEPIFSFNESLTKVQIGPLLKDLMGDDKILGTANLQAKLTAKGAGPDAIRRTLNGTASFRFEDGMVNGINVAQLLREVSAKLKGEKLAESDEPNATDFAALSGSAKIKNGVVTNDNFDARSPLLRVQGAGNANLVKESMDYRVRVAIVGTLEGQGGEALQDLKGLTIPLRVHGTFAEPRFRVELDKVLAAKNKAKLDAKKAALKKREAQAKAKLDKKVEDKKDDLKRKLEEKLKKYKR